MLFLCDTQQLFCLNCLWNEKESVRYHKRFPFLPRHLSCCLQSPAITTTWSDPVILAGSLMSLVKRKDRVLGTAVFTAITCISSNLHLWITCGKSETQADEEAIWGKPGEATGLTCFLYGFSS